MSARRMQLIPSGCDSSLSVVRAQMPCLAPTINASAASGATPDASSASYSFTTVSGSARPLIGSCSGGQDHGDGDFFALVHVDELGETVLRGGCERVRRRRDPNARLARFIR